MKTVILLALLISILTTSLSFAQPGTLDSIFSKDGKIFTSIGDYNDGANAVSIQKNGKILAAGYSLDSTGKSAFALVRYSTRGKIDPSFGNKGIVTTYFHNKSSVANAMAIQNDGKIIVAGNTQDGIGLARYLPDGSLDHSFSSKGKVIDSTIYTGNAIAIQTDSKIVVVGTTSNYHSGSSKDVDIAVVRYKPNGSPDSSFGVNGKVITDGGGVDKYHPHNNDYGNAIAVLPDGKIIVGGHSDVYDGNYAFVLFRYKPNGEIDSSFGVNGMALTFMGGWYSFGMSMAILPNGKILLAGYTEGLVAYFAIAEYKRDGILDPGFGKNGTVIVSTYPYLRENFGKSIAVQQNGKIVVAGFAESGNYDTTRLELMRFTPHGLLDSSFGTNGIIFSNVQAKYGYYQGGPAPAVALQPDGKIVVAGNGRNKFSVVRYNSDPVTEHRPSDDIFSKQMFATTSLAYVSPNPVKDIFQIQHLSSSAKTILILDLKGKTLQQVVTAKNNFSFNVSQSSAGMYLVKIYDDEKTATLKFIKE